MAEIISFETGTITDTDADCVGFTQAVEAAANLNPLQGIICFYTQEDQATMNYLSFGQLSRKDALWMAHELMNYARGADE